MKKSLKKSLDKVIKNHGETFKKLAKNDTQATYLDKLPKPKKPTITWVAMFPDFQDLTYGYIMDSSKVPSVFPNNNTVFDVMKVDEYESEVWKLLGRIENLEKELAWHENYHRNR